MALRADPGRRGSPHTRETTLSAPPFPADVFRPSIMIHCPRKHAVPRRFQVAENRNRAHGWQLTRRARWCGETEKRTRNWEKGKSADDADVQRRQRPFSKTGHF